MRICNKLFCLLVFVIVIFSSINNSFSQNMLNNGSFEYGGPGLGFVVNGQGYNLVSPPYSGSTSSGNYAFVTNPQIFNNSFFVSSGDHTTGTGKMMVIDGTTTGGNQRFWEAGNTGGGVCNLVVGQTYTFSYWIRTVTATVAGINDLANIIVTFNNANNVTQISGTALAPMPSTGWQKVSYSFVPTSSCVNIQMHNTNLNFAANDFAIDDMSVLPPPQPLSATYSITHPNCSDTISGIITVYPRGGIEPYSYQLIDSLSNTTGNSTGLFQDLTQGNYSFIITDATGAVYTDTNIILITSSVLSVNPSTATICPGSSITFTASGGNNSYTWTSSNGNEPGFPNNNSSVTVSPTVNTNYQVSTQNSFTVNLIYNGDFELGNEGFGTSYVYYTPNNPTGAQRAYGVLTNPSVWYNTFSPCQDHTFSNGSGKMLVVDGSTFNIGNDKLWVQKVAVKPNTNYVFNYWLTSLTSTNLAQIKTTFNGVSLGTTNAPSVLCNWINVSYNWNSGNDTILEVCLYKSNFQASGNDFAIDDISLLSTENCSQQVSVTVLNNCDVILPEMAIPSAFTPNGDSKNDFWELVNIDQIYPENLVMVYNRWGELLYESEKGNYASRPWDGTYKNKALPVGSYFYIIKLKNDDTVKPLNGSVSIILKN
ncbi:MAG: gliding motility-associated C-terminal domain-containing protein [Bacteroidota bacterium]